MAYLDFKVTSWKRVFIPDNKVTEVINKLTLEDIVVPYDLMEESGMYEVDIFGEEPMTITENGGCCTQEIFTDEGDSQWMNTAPTEL
jgi:hypothetical protein